MPKPAFRPLSLGILAASALACVPPSGASADTYDDWQYSATLYLWAAGIQAETPGGAEADVDFSTLISNLNLAFMGGFEARKDRWALAADLIYLNVGANDNGTVPVRVASGAVADLNVSASVATQGWVLSVLGAYNLHDGDKARVDAFFGARYLDLELDFSLALAYPGQFGVEPDFAASQTSWDAIVGVKGRLNLDGPWHLPYYLDLGTGQSDLTWQAAGGVGYALGQGEVSLLYRYASWELGSEESLDNISFSGPLLAGTWHF